MKQSLLIILLLFAFGATNASAQSKTITGKVVSSDDGLSLPGVSVHVKGTAVGVQTSPDGNYSIAVPSGSKTLEFSYIGYTTQSVTLTGKAIIDVKLVPDSKQLSEVVVSGYGLTQRKKDITGANAVIDGKDIANLPTQSFDRAIQGKAAGVQVTSSSGIPGANVQIRIRGVGSINAGNDPLYIVDGVEVSSGDKSRLFPTTNALAGINPNDIESINIMKDAASASIYGAQAANGVVVITTKKGKSGQTLLTFSSYLGSSQIIKKQAVLSGPEFVTLSREAVKNRYGTAIPASVQTLLNSFGDPSTAPTYDWQDAVYRKGITQNYSLNASGGDEKTKFFVSAAYDKQQGQEIGQDFTRGVLRVNLDHQMSKKFSFETKLNLSGYNQNGTTGGTAFASPNRSSTLIVPINPIYNADGTYNTSFIGSYNINLVQNTSYNDYSAFSKRGIGNFAFNYKILPDLKFRSSYSLDYTDIVENQYQDPRTVDGSAVNGRAQVVNTTFKDYNIDQTLNYTHVFSKKHSLGVIAGFTFKQEINDGNNASGIGFVNYQLRTLQSAATPESVGSFYTTYKQLGVFGRVDYTYDDKYIFSGTVRHDGSSRFGINNLYGTFPAASVGWRISKEDFLSNIQWIEDLKLRGSYGILGNSQIGNFDSRSLYTGSGEYNTQPGLAPTLGNDNLTWEQATTADLGIDFSFFKGRLAGGIGAFRKTTSRLLLDRNLPVTNGFASIRSNLGRLQNEGLEFELNTTNLVVGGFKWTTNGNLTVLRSKLLELNDGLQSLASTYFVGQPLLEFFVSRYAGVNAADGNAMFYDINNNITYSPTAADRVLAGSQLPTGYGGINNNFTYKGVTLSAFVQFQYGNKIQNTDGTFLLRSGSGLDRNQDAAVLRRWQKPGDVTDQPRAYYNTGTPGTVGGITYLTPYTLTDRFIEDGSYIRLKTVTLSYDFPSKLLKRVNIRSLQVYAQAYNVVTWTKFTGADPEVSGGTFSGVTPQYKNIIFGVQLGF
ncbi:MAG: TonB-dependent receptor [Mucilaginibacter sp.]|uniref:SusC/RagA family TonB-linked outer membrane protein n=1 Tax=Mucilaginibacter sp. TaxID=1882438 RepID=UPI003264916B